MINDDMKCDCHWRTEGSSLSRHKKQLQEHNIGIHILCIFQEKVFFTEM